MKIIQCLWKEQFVEKLQRKHQVSTDEVEEVFSNSPRFDFVSKGDVIGEDVYWALGQTDAGRYLTIFFVYKHLGLANANLSAWYDCKRKKASWKKIKRKS